jgi:hypothetical protein
MIPHKQLFRHKPDEGQIGDCWRTCLACLLDKRPEEVPHLYEDCWTDYQEGARKTAAYLATQGLASVECVYQAGLADVLRSVGGTNPGLHYILNGTSRAGCGHSVICCDDAIVWDPSLDDNGIVGPMEDGYYWVTWLVPLSLRRGQEGGAA